MSKRASQREESSASNIPPEQLDLPVSFKPDGQMVTLRQVMEPGHGRVLPPSSFSPKQRAELTTKRIEAQPHFEVAMLSAGVIDQQRALREIRAQSDIGRALIEIEILLIQNLLDQVLPN